MTDLEGVEREFNNLSRVAPALNKASDDMKAVITALDERLQKLGIGISLFLPPDDQGVSFGYTKVCGRQWGIAAKQGENCWLLGDAPRELRLQFASKIRPLLAELVTASVELTNRTRGRVTEMKEIVEAMK